MSVKKAETAKELIEAFRKAKDRVSSVNKRISEFSHPDRVSINIPEMGIRCHAYDCKDLERMVSQHIKNTGMSVLDTIEFRNRMSRYKSALATLIALHEEWRQEAGIDVLEQESADADDERDRTWKAVLARIKSHPRDIPVIAAYFSSEEGSTGDFWRPRQLLGAVGKACSRKA